MAWLELLRDAWGDEVVIQIYGGKIRIRSDERDWRFENDAELGAATTQRCGIAEPSKQKQGRSHSTRPTKGEAR